MKKGFLTNKYTLSVFILLAILATDIVLHKGMSRVILPEKFTDKRQPQTSIPRCDQRLEIKGKHWAKGINTTAQMLFSDSSISGFEIDVYFDTTHQVFYAYHDSSEISEVNAEMILLLAEKKESNPSIWLDFKNLQEHNKQRALQQLLMLRDKYNLHNRIIVESPNAAALRIFCDNAFFTSFYTPYFNPYTEKEAVLAGRIDSIASVLKKYPVSALSGYYFQIPFLKKFFPAFPLLTWTEHSDISLVNRYFNYQLEKDPQVRVVLQHIEN